MFNRETIRKSLASATGTDSPIRTIEPLGGGCINASFILTLDDGRRYFVKSQAKPPSPDYFHLERHALELLAASGIIKVPRPVVCGDDFLVLEAFTPGTPAPDWNERLGRQLAQLHLATRHHLFGFEHDNFLGTTPQANGWSRDWTCFWREKRLGSQLALFSRKTRGDDPLLSLGAALMERLEEILHGCDDPPVLLHGDLWSGNAAADEHGEPVIFDPASYYGQREAEIAMMRLFGGFGPRCEAAYQEVWPFAEGHERRIMLYRLYHELNHLNLFGAAYYGMCLDTMHNLMGR